MDTKLKKSRMLRAALGAAAVLLTALVSLQLFPRIAASAERWWEENNWVRQTYYEQVYNEILEPVYHGSYVLALENENFYEALEEQTLLAAWDSEFANIRDRVDYYVANGDGSRVSTNNTNNLGGLIQAGTISDYTLKQIADRYSSCFCLYFDEEGILTVESIFDEPGPGEQDWIIKRLQTLDRENQNLFQEVYNEETLDWEVQKLERPKNLTVVWGISREWLSEVSGQAEYIGYWERIEAYQNHGAKLLYYGTLLFLLLILLLLTSRHIWKERIDYHRIGKFRYGEAAVMAAAVILFCSNDFAIWIYYYGHGFGEAVRDPLEILTRMGDPSMIIKLLWFAGMLIFLYGVWYLALAALRPVFSLGIRQYVREYSFIYLAVEKCGGWFRRKWALLREEIRCIEFDGSGMRAIRKVVIFNFVVLAIISCLWIIGIPVLVLYSVVLFFLLKRQYDLARGDYGRLLSAASRLAEGDLNAIKESEEWGMFEPVKGELEKIRSGFSKAVDEEVKSQRMKTELITNVSHDLKTPLTAITTYVELLKNPDITPEERASYIDTLERKALRLKVLIEDLFEVSKATSNNMKLELMAVDVVNLIKQVSVEHTDRFAARGLELRYQMPEKAVCTLDGQKTYRIFENLFVNIEKYAMEGSRVYVEVRKEPEEENVCGETAAENPSCGQPKEQEGKTRIVLKNMSAAELNVRPEELTERFVRGDDSRNTEGSGLGLAIVRSFTEAQGGSFWVEVDGDLFKAVILF